MRMRRGTRLAGAASSLALAAALVTGSPVARADVSDGPGCAGSANGVGVTLYCLESSTGGIVLTLANEFAGVPFHNCMDREIPDGMRAPADRRDEPGKYWLQTCLQGVDLDTVDGGNDIEVTLGFHFVPEGEDAYDEDELNDLEERVWAEVEEGTYPLPILTAFPTHIPRVNVATFFQFKWLFFEGDGTRPAQAPGTTGTESDPYVQIRSGAATLTARSVGISIDPQIEGMPVEECGADPPTYDKESDPDPDEQANDCYVEFDHSSAVAEDLSSSDVPLPKESDEYPLPVYLLKITVRWEAVMRLPNGEIRNLGVNDFVAYQALPVTEIQGQSGVEL